MLKPHLFTDEPTPIEGVRLPIAHRLSLLIIGEGFVATHPLPSTGDLIIGRSAEADITIDVTCVSRRHALLHIGDAIRVEDLGSANGTFVGEERLARGVAATLQPGSMFELGSTMLILQDKYSASRPRRIWTHGYFEARLEEECARAERSQSSFALLRVRVEDKESKALALHEILLSSLRPGDILASYGPDDYEVLVVDTTAEESRRLLKRLCERMRERGAKMRTGMACYPNDGRVPAALMARACGQVDNSETSEDTNTGIVVEAGVMKSLHRLVERVAASDINVLLLGETGVGKEVFAERIHALSPRVTGPLLRLNCAALSESLLESELFGHERGAFTGAVSSKPGLLETANGGTVFLDEIGDMPLSLQAKLLRVLESRRVRRVGSLKDRPIDIRVLAATHRDLESEAEAGRFRQDLFFRINGMSIVIPSLRERLEEIGPLAHSFISATCKRQGKRPVKLGAAALRAMQRYDWPGNIRELRNVMERAVLLCSRGDIELEHLPADKMASTFEMSKMTRRRPPIAAPRDFNATPLEGSRALESPDQGLPLRAGVDEREREIIRDALATAGGNQTKAAKLLGISRRTLISRLDKYGLPRPRKGRRP